MSMTEVWNILARFDVDGEEEVLDFATDKVEACKLVAYYQLANGPYAVVRKQKVGDDLTKPTSHEQGETPELSLAQERNHSLH